MESDMTSPRISDRTRAVLENLPAEKRARAKAIIAQTQTPEARARDAADRSILEREYHEAGRIATLSEKLDPEDLAAFRAFIATLRDARLTRGMSLEELADSPGAAHGKSRDAREGVGQSRGGILSRSHRVGVATLWSEMRPISSVR